MKRDKKPRMFAEPVTIQVVKCNGLNIRGAKTYDSKVLAIAPRGRQLIAPEGLIGDWVWVRWDGIEGYARREYLEEVPEDDE